MNDFKELEEDWPQDESKCLSNFVIDSYLQIIKSESSGVEVIRCETFEKGVGKRKVEQLLQGKRNLLQQKNIVFFLATVQPVGIGFLEWCFPWKRVLL